MSIDHLWAALLGAMLGLAADFLFLGMLFRERYGRYPGVWRETGGKPWLMPMAFGLTLLSAAGVTLLVARFEQTDPRGALTLAAMIWLAAPLPLLVANGVAMKIDPLVTTAHVFGWLVKLLLMGTAAALLL